MAAESDDIVRETLVKRPQPISGSYSLKDEQIADIWAAVQSMNEVAERGHLEKLSGNGKYQKRFFVLNGGFLMYWPNEKSQKKGGMPDAALDLTKVQDVKFQGSGIEITSKTLTFAVKNTKPRKDKDEPVKTWKVWLDAARGGGRW